MADLLMTLAMLGPVVVFVPALAVLVPLLVWKELGERKARRRLARLWAEYLEAIGRDRIAEEEETNGSGI